MEIAMPNPLEDFLGQVTSSDEDTNDEEANRLLEQIMDEIRLERLYPPSESLSKPLPNDEDLELELGQGEIVEHVGNIVAELEEKVAALRNALDNKRESPYDTSALSGSNQLNPTHDKQEKLMGLPLSPTIKMTSSNVPLAPNNVDSSPSKTVKPESSGGFFHKLKTFFKSIGSFLNNLVGKKVSLEKAVESLTKARNELSSAGNRLKSAGKNLAKAQGDIIEKQKALNSAFIASNEARKVVLNNQRKLITLQKSDTKMPIKKAMKEKIIKNIEEAQSTHKKAVKDLEGLGRQVKEASSIALTASSVFNEAKTELAAATKGINSAIKAVEKAQAQQHNISKQGEYKHALNACKKEAKLANDKIEKHSSNKTPPSLK
jgi:hypothetical protein